MDGAAAFLHRRERSALARRRKREPLRAVAPVTHAGLQGLLGLTSTRILYAQRGRLRTNVAVWPRRDVASVGFDPHRYGAMLVRLRTGKRLRFEFAARQDAAAFQDVAMPRRRAVGPPTGGLRDLDGAAPGARYAADPAVDAPAVAFPVVFAGAVRVHATGAAADPLAHRGTPAHVARLRDMHARGLLTRAELEWQLAA